jgi:ABC-type transport system involved in multi-copper enzyme maturation permease subunit
LIDEDVKVIWTIARKQLLANVLTFRFVIGFVLCIILFPLSAAILTRDYEERLATFNTAVSQHTARVLKSRVFSELNMTLDRRPALLSPFCEGFDKRFASSADVSYTAIPTVSTGSSEKNPFMATMKSIDLVAIIQVVLGLLAFLFAYDAVSGERERGTLALGLSNPLPRHSLLLGSYLGGLLTVLPLLLTGLGLAMLVCATAPAPAAPLGVHQGKKRIHW